MKSTLGLLALAAAGAHAIMIPSTVALENINAELGPTTLFHPFTNIIEIACPGCLFAQPHEGGFIWTKGVENSLILNISVGSNPSSLELNDVQFYPPLMTLSSEPPIPTIIQIPAGVTPPEAVAHPEQYASLRLTSWSFHAGSASTINGQGHEIISISLHLGALETQDINVPDLSITAIKDTEGILTIVRLEQTPALDSPPDKGTECTGWPLLCKWKAMLAAKLSAWKNKMHGHHGCGKGKGKGAHAKPTVGAGADEPHRSHHKGPDGKHHGHGHGHRHHSKLHRMLHAIARVLLTVLVPVLVGVAAGMLLYLVGYAVGASLAFVVARVVGRRAAGYRPIVLVEDDEREPRASTEKCEYADEDAGEAPPRYVEVEGEAVLKV